MALERLDADFAYKVLENEGLDYAILYYFGRELVTDDPTFDVVWRAAYDALEEIKRRLDSIPEE